MTDLCPMQHHDPDPWAYGETTYEYVGLCRYDLALPENHHLPHDDMISETEMRDAEEAIALAREDGNR